MNQIYIALFYFLMSYSDCQILQSSYIVGDIEYSVDINQGESIITVPIPNLKGVNNFQPEISLVYRSNNYLLHKEFGLGWSLNGLFEISRCSKTFAHDNRFDNIKFDNSDKFCLNDQRLILVEGNYGANNSIYQTEMQSYKKIIAYGDSNVPSHFKIFTSDNRIMWLGRSDDSKLSSNDVTFKWMLNKIEDYLGNAIYFTYLKDTNYCYLKTIEYANKQIDFFYTKSLNNQTSYYSNQILTSTNSLLKLVVFSAKNNYNNLTKLKSYEFSYKKYMPIGYNILKQIKMCYADKKCVRPLSFDYDDENSQANKFSKSIKKDNICGNKASTCELKQMIDVNGDNILDIVAFGYDGVYVSLNIENEYFSDAQIWISEFVEKTGWKSTKHYRFMADVDSDGLPDIVGFGEDGVYVAINKKTYFKAIEKWHNNFAIKSSWEVFNFRTLADLNKDGFLDIIGFLNSTTYVAYGDGKKFEGYQVFSQNFESNQYWGLKNPIFLTDINADENLDLFGLYNNYSNNSYYVSNTKFQLKYQYGSFADISWDMEKNTRIMMDMNNDGLPDLFGINDVNQALVGLNTIDSKNPNTITFVRNIWSVLPVKTNHRHQTLADCNGDGYVDLILFDCSGVMVLINNGKQFINKAVWNTEINKCDTEVSNKIAADVDGDGLSDVGEFFNHSVIVAFNMNKKPRLIKITDSLLNQKLFEYVGLFDSLDTDQTMPSDSELIVNGLVPEVVGSYSSSDGIGGFSKIDYKYGYFVCNKTQGRSACTFTSVKHSDTLSKTSFQTEFHTNYPYTGIIKSKKTIIGNVVIFTEDFSYYDRKKQALENKIIHDVLLASHQSNHYDLNGNFTKKILSNYKHDVYGNVVFSCENVTDHVTNFSKMSYFHFKISNLNLENWYLSQLESKKEVKIIETNNRIESKTIEEHYEFAFETRLLVKKTYLPNQNIGLEETYTYDKFGNILSVAQKDLGTYEIRNKYYNYDSNGLNAISETNAINHSAYYSYDLFDNLIFSKNFDGITINYEYSLNGKLKAKNKTDIFETHVYEWDNSVLNAAYSITKETLGDSKIKTIYDSLNRVIRKVNYGFKSEEIYEDTIYDKNGQITKKSAPYFALENKPNYVLFEYDELLRETKRTEFDFSKNTSKSFHTIYDGLTIIKQDTEEYSKIQKNNIIDQIESITDSLGSTSYYSYDAMNNLIQIVDPQGTITTMEYDLNNEMIEKIDPYMGTSHHKYNSFKELIETTYSNQMTIKFERDRLGRMINRIEPEGSTKWIYDTGKNGLGKIHKIISSDNTKEFSYDSNGRLEETISKIENEIYSTTIKYDKFGKEISNKYSSNFILYNCYNENGFLNAVSLNDSECKTFIWKAKEYDASYNILKEEDQNGIETEYSYNTFSQVTGIKASRMNTIFRQLEYEYDSRKNLAKKIDYNSDGIANINIYDYDSIDRLISDKLFERKRNSNDLVQENSWKYDRIGNIIYSKQGKEKVYFYDSIKPQILNKIGQESIKYDHFGRLTKTDSYEIDWNSFSKPNFIKVNESLINYKYGPNREKIFKSYNDKTRIHYIDNNYEKWFVYNNNTSNFEMSEKFYIKALNKLIALKVVTNSKESMFYIKTDPFGSVESINKDDGNLIVKYRYSVFGNRETIFSNMSSEMVQFFDLGFSSKEHIIEDRLIDFNGRLYDCVLSRFLSPDPLIQEPYNIQNLNRYSYALNNPYKYNDPTGHFFKKLFKTVFNIKFLAAVFVSVATVGLMSGYAAGIAASITTSSVAAGIISGAILGASSGFASTLVMTGNLKASFKGAFMGGISGGLMSGSKYLSSNYLTSKFGNNELTKLGIETSAKGIHNKINGKDFFDGAAVGVLSSGMSMAYTKIVNYKITYESGGPAVKKGLNDPPVEGANNIGTIEKTITKIPYTNIEIDWTEGGPLSEFLNKIPGINAVAGMHDVFQSKMNGNIRDILNVPGMPIAAAMTYVGLYSQIQCPMCAN